MGGFLGIGGQGEKTDRRQTLAGYGDLSNVFNFGMSQGANSLSAGNQTEQSALAGLADPAKYYQSLLSGNRAATLSAVAPTVNAANAQTDAQKRQLATTGTARGGGVNATGQQLDTAKMSSIDNAINQAKSTAAEGATKVAGVTSSIGATQLQTATNLLGLGGNAAQNLTADSIDARKESQAINQAQQQQIENAVSAVFGALA